MLRHLLPKLLVLAALICTPAAHAQDDLLFDFATGPVFKVPGLEIDSGQAWGNAWGDYNNDSWLDLVVAENGPRLNLFYNEEGPRLISRNNALQIDTARIEKSFGTVWGDYDNDLDLDLHTSLSSCVDANGSTECDTHPIMIQRNEGGLLRVATEEAGIGLMGGMWHALWLDYDRDGHLDLYVTPENKLWGGSLPDTPEKRNRLLRNRGDGTFADTTEQAGLLVSFHPEAGSSMGGLSAADFNGDGWPDLFVAVRGADNRLFLNDGAGHFTEVQNVDLKDNGEATGLAVGDIDNDGDLDLFVAAGSTGPQETRLFRSQMLLNIGEGILLDVTEGVGMSEITAAQGHMPVMGDFDNDGDLDLSVTPVGGDLPPRHLLYLNNGDGTFVEAPGRTGMILPVTGHAMGDYNRDGFLDIFHSLDVGKFGEVYPASVQPGRIPRAGGNNAALRVRNGNSLYRGRPNGNHFLRVELVGNPSNRSAIGAQLTASSGDLHQTRQILGGDGFGQDELISHFGLGTRTRVDSLQIRWPSGQVEVLRDIDADQQIRVIEGRGAYHAAPGASMLKPSISCQSTATTLAISSLDRIAIASPRTRSTAN